MAYNPFIITHLAKKYCGAECINIEKIPQSGSGRLYFRLFFEKMPSLIGVYNSDLKENEAFFHLSRFFRSRHIHVPELLDVDESNQYYLLNDLGDETLYSFLVSNRRGEKLGESVLRYYHQVLKELPGIQLAGQEMDFSFCYPRSAFDRQSMQWDLNYFKYYFLKLAGIPFDEQLLEDDFNTCIDFLLQAESNYFLYRDFQSRNIMIHNDQICFIDYQGGRKGALQYDVASLLYDGKADISPSDRDELLDFYLNELEKYLPDSRDKFLFYYDTFVLIRILQALGTYGFRGYYEKKPHFLLSIPYAIRNIRYLLDKDCFPILIPELGRVLKALTESEDLPAFEDPDSHLTVFINSFSYKKGIPQDLSVNGGGFVFDCRALPNPGREEQYRSLNGKDAEVIEFMKRYPQTDEFRKHTFALVDASVENYLERGFTRLMVNYGCTGGQHRSVFFAEEAARHLHGKFPGLKIILKHTQQQPEKNR